MWQPFTKTSSWARCKWQHVQQLCRCQLPLFAEALAATKCINLVPTSWQHSRHCKSTNTRSEVLVLTLIWVINRPSWTWSLQCVLCIVSFIFRNFGCHWITWTFCLFPCSLMSLFYVLGAAVYPAFKKRCILINAAKWHKICTLQCSSLYSVPTGIIWNYFVVHTIRRITTTATKFKTTYTVT